MLVPVRHTLWLPGLPSKEKAVLLGHSPQWKIEDLQNRLPDLPPLPEPGVPIELVRWRPDIRSTNNLLQAADRDLAVAISSKYPRLSVSTSLRSNNLKNIFKDWAYSLG